MLRPKVLGLLAAAALTSISGAALAYDTHGLFPQDPSMQRCYGAAMVGMDSVINSRIGVPAEHALDLARVSSRAPTSGDGYSTELLSNVLYAYLWEGSPHSYAVKVFFDCAQGHAPVHSASSAVDISVP